MCDSVSDYGLIHRSTELSKQESYNTDPIGIACATGRGELWVYADSGTADVAGGGKRKPGAMGAAI